MSNKYQDIVRKPAVNDTMNASKISKQEALQDLDEVAKIIKQNHSYIHTVDFNYQEALSEIKESLDDSVSVSVLALQIHKLVQHLGDSHAYVNNWMDLLPKQFAPAKYGIRNGRIFAYDLNVDSLLANQFPYVKSIDNVPIKKYFERAGAISSGEGSSESSKFFRGRQLMQYIGFMRSELGIAQGSTVEYVLESEDGLKEKKVVLPVSTKSDFTKPFGLTKVSSILPNNIGYLRMYSQNDTVLLKSIDSLMISFKDTQALIIDARQCGGGKRSNLQALFPYFMNMEDSPYIANVAKLRIPQDVSEFDPKGKLDVGDKKLKYIEDDDTTKDELEALHRFLTDFEPAYEASNTDFTDWYFMAMTAKPGKFYYDKPVYLIMDFGVGSAGDIFVSTFKNWRNVTLVGSPSNGRSGNSITTKLQHSGIPVRLSTMISYQKDGGLFDWVGIQPDVNIEPEISDWLEETDTVLDQVLIMANN
ncbi:S41 family peptidase [Arenibacter antarcticus]